MRRAPLTLVLLTLAPMASAEEKHWAFRPPANQPVPAVRDATWARTPLDRFILSKLEAAGLRPASAVDKRTLIRRATFDLTGLPPTPEEIDAFLNDVSPGAFATVVDRLLASPAYGERWGRHWLDVARYADSNGLDENIAHGNAWRYRDYVVAAFNRDKPYDQFLIEQIAGDVLPADSARHEHLIATGFLALGPKVLAEVDERKMEMDIIDEQIDTVGRSVLGLTLGCARCHDHKFDPISTEDYYALAGVFKSTRTMEHFKKIARWWENPLASDAELKRKAELDAKIAKQKDAIQKIGAKTGEKSKAELKRLREELAALEKSLPELPSAMGVSENTVAETSVHIRGSHLTLGKQTPRRVPTVLNDANAPKFDAKHSGRLELARWLARPDHPLTSRVMVNRIWRWHFGEGLARTTDNFGKLGEAPSHPKLLDWLARRFAASGWSIKAMHRLIMLSATYQQAMPSRRLEAEAIRDALLAVSGGLDRTMGGSLLHVKNREFFFDHTSKDTTKYHSPRRSLYLPVVRNHLYDVFQLFDSTDATVPSGDRVTTTVAPQALFMLNSPLVLKASDRLSTSLLADATLDDAGRARRLYRRCYGREATADEVTKGLDMVRACEREFRAAEPDAAKLRVKAWACLAQTVLAANEFIYVR